MNRCLLLILTILVWVPAGIVSAEEPRADQPLLRTTSQKFSYIMGKDVITALQKLNTEVDLDAFILGATDRYKGNKPLLSKAEIAAVKREISKKEKEKQQKRINQIAAKNLKEGKRFLLENQKKKGVVVTQSGLQYKVVREGKGPFPKGDDEVLVHYRGLLTSGKEFDSSYKRGGPTKVRVDDVLPGWAEALKKMKAGSQYRIFLPPRLAYGPRYSGIGGAVGPNSTIIFDVELLKIFPASEKQAASQP